MMKNILINNGNLGRMGKTTLATTIYRTAKKSYCYVTNDLENSSIDLVSYVDDEDLVHSTDPESINIDTERNCVFDFGGKPDARLKFLAGYVDIVIVPIAYQSISELQLTVKNINFFKEHGAKEIIVVVNNADREDANLLEMTFKASFPEIKIFTINHSKYIRRLANNNQTVFEVAEASKLDASQLNKTVIPQFKALFNYLNISI